MDETFDSVKAFEEYHGVDIPEWWDRGRTLVRSVRGARDASRDALRSASEEKQITEPTIGFLDHLLDRAYEHVAASVVCFATGNIATAEVAARAAMETSANIRYILVGDRNSRFLTWLRAFIEEDKKQIRNWETALPTCSDDEAKLHREGIERRRSRLANNEELVKQLELEFLSAGFDPNGEKWPKIAGRFEAIGELVSYRTAYARMSSQTHADAEDTISFILSKVHGDDQSMLRMASETMAFSEYLIHYSARFFVEALGQYDAVFAGTPSDKTISGIDAINVQMAAIGESWGW